MQDNDQRQNLKKDTWVIIVAILAVVFIFGAIENKQEIVYDCGMAEWHPDIPKQVKEECRKLRYEEWKKNNGNKYRT